MSDAEKGLDHGDEAAWALARDHVGRLMEQRGELWMAIRKLYAGSRFVGGQALVDADDLRALMEIPGVKERG